MITFRDVRVGGWMGAQGGAVALRSDVASVTGAAAGLRLKRPRGDRGDREAAENAVGCPEHGPGAGEGESLTGPRLNSRFRSGLSRRAVIGALGIAGAGAVLGTAACGNDSSSRTSATSTDPTADGAARASATPDVVDLADLPSYDYEGRDLSVADQETGETIEGRLYVPTAPAPDGPVPLVVCSHGLLGSVGDLDPVARALAGVGLASYCIAFRNGGPEAGDTTRMSIMTEVADLEAVLTAARSAAGGWEVVDPQRIVLHGVSQGGAVSTITAARHPQEVAGLALWYPAFSIADDLHQVFGSLDEVPETITAGQYSLGRVYAEDIWDYDVYADMPRYTSPVLIVHGTADTTSPISYSERAAQTFPDASLVTIDDAGHGFSGSAWDRAMGSTAAYLQRIGALGG